jgi:hypothetical protein
MKRMTGVVVIVIAEELAGMTTMISMMTRVVIAEAAVAMTMTKTIMNAAM